MGLGVGVIVAVGVTVGVDVAVAVAVGVAVGVALGVTVGMAVGVAVGVGVGVPAGSPIMICTTPSLMALAQRSGYAPRSPRESAIIATLPPGNYTAVVRGVNNTTGVGLVEVYELNQ